MFGLTIGNKVLFEKIMQKYKKQYQNDHQTNKHFDKLYRKSLQDNLIEKNEDQSLCSFFTKYVEEKKNDVFYKYEHQLKIKAFNSNKTKINLQPRT